MLSYGLAGACATLVHDFIMNPAEVVKQRMQMKYSPYGGSLECARCIYRSEGISAFYRSYTIQLASNIPYQAIHFMTYEFLQQVYLKSPNLFISNISSFSILNTSTIQKLIYWRVAWPVDWLQQ